MTGKAFFTVNLFIFLFEHSSSSLSGVKRPKCLLETISSSPSCDDIDPKNWKSLLCSSKLTIKEWLLGTPTHYHFGLLIWWTKIKYIYVKHLTCTPSIRNFSICKNYHKAMCGNFSSFTSTVFVKHTLRTGGLKKSWLALQ